MLSHLILSSCSQKRMWLRIFQILFLSALLLYAFQVASAQCFPNPTWETSVGLQNSSSYFLIFYIDGVNKGGVPSGDRSLDFNVTPGEHTLKAEAIISGETVSVWRTVYIPAFHVCTWTVTDPPELSLWW